MNEKFPMDYQVVEVRLGNDEWQPATYRDGEFVDAFGLPLDRTQVSKWRPTNTQAANH